MVPDMAVSAPQITDRPAPIRRSSFACPTVVTLHDPDAVITETEAAWIAGYFLGRRDALAMFPWMLRGKEKEQIDQAMTMTVSIGFRPPPALLPAFLRAVAACAPEASAA